MSHDAIRKHMLKDIQLDVETRSYSQLLRSQWSPEFEHAMRMRLLMGRFRYGDFSSPEKGKYKNIQSAISRLTRYLEEGNQELLIDAANLCMIEFVHPNHPAPHFTPEDDGEHAEAL